MIEKSAIYRELVEMVIKERGQHMIQYLKENYCDLTSHANGVSRMSEARRSTVKT